MVENIEAILDRGDKIELLVDKSGDLSEQVIAPGLAPKKHPPPLDHHMSLGIGLR